jgi:broad specificity phosphatase PhoE
VHLYLLRHGEVISHRGDVPITAAAERHAFEVGRNLGLREREHITVLSGDTLRTVDTARHLASGVVDTGGQTIGREIAFALRNPDLYLAGTRVDMVSSTDALADQVNSLSPDDVGSLEFFPEFIESPDRIGWWLAHESPPGEDASSVAARFRAFAASFVDPVPGRPNVVVAVTHSPLLRAAGLDLLGHDIGEPPWISGLLVTVRADRTMSAEIVSLECR